MDALGAENTSPVLGSALLKSLDDHQQTKGLVSSGCATLDEEVLQGGFKYGEMSCLAGSFADIGKLVRTSCVDC